MSRYGHTYRKGQKLNKRKVLQFIGFHSSRYRESFRNFRFICIENDKESHCTNIHQKNFCDSLKICKNFSCVTFVIYDMSYEMKF